MCAGEATSSLYIIAPAGHHVEWSDRIRLMAESTERRPPWSCRDCGRRWASLVQAHCVVCHQHFSGMTAADRHQRKGRCLSPSDVGLVVSDEKHGAVWRFRGSRPTPDASETI